MKTFNTIRIILISIIGILMCSCTPSSKPNTRVYKNEDCPFKRIKKFEYSGHQYISFSRDYRVEGVGVVHDPDCKCQKVD